MTAVRVTCTAGLIFGVLGFSAPSSAQSALCTPATTALHFDGGYRVSMCYRTPDGRVAQANAGLWESNQSGLLWFFNRENAEVLVKVLDGCSENGHRWVFVAPVTTLEFNLWVRAPNGNLWTHTNRQGETASAKSDVAAFRCADEPGSYSRHSSGSGDIGARGVVPVQGHTLATGPVSQNRLRTLAVQTEEGSDFRPLNGLVAAQSALCTPTATALHFDGGYRVSMCYRTPDGRVAQANAGLWESNQSGLLWFFNRENAEVLVKVLDGCSENGHRWVFVAPVTTLEFNLWVTGPNGDRWAHTNRQGVTASTRSDVAAFRCADEPAGTPPDLTVGSPSASRSNLDAGERFTLHATVRNQGGERSSSTTLRYYRSSDFTIGASDFLVGTDAVEALSASGTSAESISLTAPSTAGTYYYGACVDSVSGETVTSNNCSNSVRVTVGSGTGGVATEYRLDDGTFEEAHIFVNSSGNPVHEQEVVQQFSLNRGGTASHVEVFLSKDANRGGGGAKPFTLNFYRDSNGQPGTRIATIPSSSRLLATDTVTSVKVDLDSYSVPLVTTCWVGIEWENSTGLALGVDLNGRGGGRPTVRVRNTSSAPWSGWAGYPANANVKSVGIRLGVDHDTSEAAEPDLVVLEAWVSDSSVATGERFTLFAALENQGSGTASATTLRYYRSSNSTIGTSDFQLAATPVEPLSTGITLQYASEVVAPSTPGTYYFGACVDPVAGETNTPNNCSGGVRVTVVGSDDGPPVTVYKYNDGTFEEAHYFVDSSDEPVYEQELAEQFSLSRSGDVSYVDVSMRMDPGRHDGGTPEFTLNFYRDSNGQPGTRMATVSSYFVSATTNAISTARVDLNSESIQLGSGPVWVGVSWQNWTGLALGVDLNGPGGGSRRVRTFDGLREQWGAWAEHPGTNVRAFGICLAIADTDESPGAVGEFDLDPDNDGPQGITYANGRFYVVDSRKVFAYDSSWNRASSYDFDLDPGNFNRGSPLGATYVNGRFYIVQGRGNDVNKVYSYDSNGDRAPAYDFDLDPDSSDAIGIEYVGGRFYVVADRKVYAYDSSGNRASAYDFNLDPRNNNPAGVTYVGGRFYVTNVLLGKVYAYDSAGNRASSHDFDLDPGNSYGYGVAYAGGRFYVTDLITEKVYAYDSSGNRAP